MKLVNKNILIALSVVGTLVIFQPSKMVEAGAIVGATEFTQIANNMELLASGQLQISQYAQQIQQYQTQLQQYRTQVQNLEKYNPSSLNEVVSINNELTNLSKLKSAVGKLYTDYSGVKTEYEGKWTEANSNGMTPDVYYQKMLERENSSRRAAEVLMGSVQNGMTQVNNDTARIQALQDSVNSSTGMQQSMQAMVHGIALLGTQLNQMNQSLVAANMMKAQEIQNTDGATAASSETRVYQRNQAKTSYDEDMTALNARLKKTGSGAMGW